MTYEEVIKALEAERKGIFMWYRDVLLDICTEAIKKQIPKKPSTMFIKSIDGKQEWFCPVCGRPLFAVYENHCKWGHKSDFCEDCGQAIDWSKE